MKSHLTVEVRRTKRPTPASPRSRPQPGDREISGRPRWIEIAGPLHWAFLVDQ